MFISHFQISNYKSLLETDNVSLGPGFNFIVGQNASGKTALVEALSLSSSDIPHRSLTTVPTARTPLLGHTTVRLTFVVDREELFDCFAEFGGELLLSAGQRGDREAELAAFVESISEHNELTCQWSPSNGFTSLNFLGFQCATQQAPSLSFKFDRKTEKFSLGEPGYPSVPVGATLQRRLADRLQHRIYCFKAERPNIGTSLPQEAYELATNAENLAQVLHCLQSRYRSRWQKYLDCVRAVLPQVSSITVPLIGSNVHVLIWPIDENTERDDLAIPLTNTGTGVGQVLAMLYVVLTSVASRTIMIDEPQSFLHPGAVRKLFEVLRQHPQHQYIVTTHSPTVLTSANPTAILRIRMEGQESKIDRLNGSDATDLRSLLAEVGARLSDVFGADSVLWVEGQTEESCFPLILAHRTDAPITGTAILALRNTGDLNRRNRKDVRAILDIYDRLSSGPALIPPAVAFLLDREVRSPDDCRRLQEHSGGRILFTKRRMYENYLLVPAAIAAVVNDIEGFSPEPITPAQIADWIDRYCADNVRARARDASAAPADRNAWLSEVHGAELLTKLFSELSETRICYRKVQHGWAITAWVLKNAPEELWEVGDLIVDALKRSASTSA